jgi:hypothetical protein
VLQILKLMDSLLKREGFDLRLTPYTVLPTGPLEGLVQYVDRSHALAHVLAQNRQDGIRQFLRSFHPSPTGPFGIAADALDNFKKSAAGYCVITYLLSVGDRHLDNLMLTEAGEVRARASALGDTSPPAADRGAVGGRPPRRARARPLTAAHATHARAARACARPARARRAQLFHIDFGYILGRDPKPLPPPMKLCREMVEAMGGADSDHYKDFKAICCEVARAATRVRAQRRPPSPRAPGR